MNTNVRTPASKRQQILRWLAQGRTITPLIALRRMRTFALSQRIGELKREGWPIASEFVKGQHYKKYWLPKARRA